MKLGRDFTLFPEGGKCQRGGCYQAGSTLGYCREHYEEEIGRRMKLLRSEGRLNPTPACFTTDQWQEYQVLCDMESPGQPVNFCRDCTPDYQAEMLAQDRCSHPETAFICAKDKTGIEGVNSVVFPVWRDVTMGFTKHRILQMPAAAVRQQIIEREGGK